MKNNMFKVLTLLVAASMLLAACGGGSASEEAAEEAKVLRVWIQWGDNPQQIQALFDKYTTETGIKVEVTAPIEDDKVLPALTGSNPPDILVLSGGDAAKSFYKEGLVDELSGAREKRSSRQIRHKLLKVMQTSQQMKQRHLLITPAQMSWLQIPRNRFSASTAPYF